jgi:hypothetical protein
MLQDDSADVSSGKRQLTENLGSKENLELRHQRNPDAFFDLFLDENEDLDDIGYERIYNTIETLLPKALSTDPNNLKLMEMYPNLT